MQFKKTIFSLFLIIIYSLFAQSLDSKYDAFGKVIEENISGKVAEKKLDAKNISDNFIDSKFIEYTYVNASDIESEFIDAKYINEKFISNIYIVNLVDYDYENCCFQLVTGEEIPFKKILKNVAIGEGTMFVAAIVFSFIPGTQPFTALIVGWHGKALAGAAIDAAVSGVVTYISSDGDVSKTRNKILESASDGFKWGAIFAVGSEAVKTAKVIKQNTIIPNEPEKGKIVQHTLKQDSTYESFGIRDFVYRQRGYTPKQSSFFNFQEEQLQKWSKNAIEACKEYSEDQRIFNEILRNVRPGTPNQLNKIKVLDNALRSNPTRETIELFRGSKNYIGDKFIRILPGNRVNIQIGEVLTDKGLLSTSFSENVAKNTFASSFDKINIVDEINIVEKIIAPKGTLGQSIESISKFAIEQEFLMPSNTSRIVRDVKIISENSIEILTEVIIP